MSLFGANKPNVTRVNCKDQYYKNYYFPKNLCMGVELVAAIERVTKKQAAELLMKVGLSSYMGEKLTEYTKNEQAAREQKQKMKMTRFVLDLRKLARERGMNISKFI
jgi:predicted DNA-binding transcriptional regulator YafY